MGVKWPTKLLVLRGILVVVGGFLVTLTLGSMYTIGNVAPYIVSYIRNQSHPSDLRQATASWIYACTVTGLGCTAFIGGLLVNKIGPRLTTLLGGWIMSIGVILTYFTLKMSFWMVLLTYGVVVGIGMGLAYTAPLSAAMKWMPKWKGLANGVVMSSLGLGALVFNPAQTLYVNPHDVPSVPDPYEDDKKFFTDPELIERVPNMFLILGVINAVMQLIGSLLITNPPSSYLTETSASLNSEDIDITNDKICEVDDAQFYKCCTQHTSALVSQSTNSRVDDHHSHDSKPINAEVISHSESERQHLLLDKEKIEEAASKNHTARNAVTRHMVVDLTPLQVLRKPNFYILWVIFLCNGIAVMFMNTLYKFFGNSFINNDDFLAAVGSTAAVFSCLGRIFWGLVADRVSYKFALVLLLATMTVFTLTFYSCEKGGEAMFFVWVCVILFCVGGISVFPTAVGKAFGLKHVATNYGMLFTSQIVAGVLGATVSSMLISRIGYYGVLFIVGGFDCIGFILTLLYRPKIYIVK